jgi:endonuclease YncB( thermonuclease family)
MCYTLLRGEFVIRYPDLPREGPEPDGDTVKFAPDSRALVGLLPRISGRAPDINGRGISVRLEAIDTLETHFNETHQELLGANAARDALLEHLGFTGVAFWPDLPNKVQAADQDRLRGHVLSNGIDANGRMIGFVYPGDPTGLDGSSVWVQETLVDRSVNALLLAAGQAYPAFYGTLPASLRRHLAEVSRAARAAQLPTGLWPRSTADPDGPAAVVSLDSLEQLVVWPKLFRRIVPYLAGGAPDFDGFDAWLRADPVHRDDKLFLLGLQEDGNIHDVVRATGDEIQLTAWPEDFIIAPDPPPPGVPTGRRPFQAGDVLVVAALPDPAGTDLGRETVTVLNATDSVVDLAGWTLVDAADGRHNLSGTLAGGAVLQVQLNGGLRLGNKGDALLLEDGAGVPVDRVTYDGSGLQPGRTICFGR